MKTPVPDEEEFQEIQDIFLDYVDDYDLFKLKPGELQRQLSSVTKTKGFYYIFGYDFTTNLIHMVHEVPGMLIVLYRPVSIENKKIMEELFHKLSSQFRKCVLDQGFRIHITKFKTFNTKGDNGRKISFRRIL